MELDLPNPRFRGAVRQLEQAVYSRLVRVPGAAVDVALHLVMRELREFGRDVDAALDYIEGLPREVQKDAAYAFFASFFDHYLPKKFLRQYVWGNGGGLELTEQEMIDCHPYISVNSCKAFRDELKKLGAGGSLSKPLRIDCPAGAYTNGTLGDFTARMSGTLEYTDADDWRFSGKMTFYDPWDFNKRPWFGADSRNLLAEVKTRTAHHGLPGTGFKITSVETDFSQSNADNTVVWKGKSYELVPDDVSGVDLTMAKKG